MKRIFLVMTLVLSLSCLVAGCKTESVGEPNTSKWSADFPDVDTNDGKAMPAYDPYWKK